SPPNTSFIAPSHSAGSPLARSLAQRSNCWGVTGSANSRFSFVSRRGKLPGREQGCKSFRPGLVDEAASAGEQVARLVARVMKLAHIQSKPKDDRRPAFRQPGAALGGNHDTLFSHPESGGRAIAPEMHFGKQCKHLAFIFQSGIGLG